jgi:5-methylcytosine-specific restriction endonuclease McrA
MCEYCHLPQRFSKLTFPIDHVIARQHHGPTIESNLALACGFCNRHKGPNIAGLDPQTRQLTRLFHPRRDSW